MVWLETKYYEKKSTWQLIHKKALQWVKQMLENYSWEKDCIPILLSILK